MTTDTVSGTKPGGMDAPPAVVAADSRRRRSPLRVRRLLALACALVGVACAIDAGWIHGKAALAQTLLERAWQRTREDGGVHRPWPWADTRPVARLHAPRQHRDQIVLAGDSGRTLAFGPGWAEASAAPNTRGVAVISGHRDTHFAWLREVATGDPIELETQAGRAVYVVTGTRVADARRERVPLHDTGAETLLLVTCWPFDAVVPGGPLRYVVSAHRIDAGDARLALAP